MWRLWRFFSPPLKTEIFSKPQQGISMETGTELGLSQTDEHQLINLSRETGQITGTAQSGTAQSHV